MTLVTRLDFALAYAGAGYPVIPLQPNGKLPLTAHGAHDSTTDEATIRAWWGLWPDANIGMTLENLVVVDIDPRNGGDVDALPHKLPDTCTARTGGGGSHYLYRSMNGTKYPGKLAPGIDVKCGPGSYICGENSGHASGGDYVWLDESEPWTTTPADAPEWLALPPGQRPNGEDPAEAIPEGGRNAHLTSLAGTMRKRNMSLDAILAALLTENKNRCKPPLGDDEVRKIAASVGRYAPGDEPKAEAKTDKPPGTHEWPPSLDLEVLAEREPQAPRSIMEGVPVGYGTGIFGHGGGGKSLNELLRAVCIAAGLAFCGLEVTRSRVMFISCEDRADILHWRLRRICSHLRVDLASLRGWLEIVDLVGRDSILVAPDPRMGNALSATAAYRILEQRMREHETQVLFIDGISDTFGGNENNRIDVKRYVNVLLR